MSGEPEDQVPRLNSFRRRHPEIDITPCTVPGNYGQWIARYDGQILARDYQLRWLLDDLEAVMKDTLIMFAAAAAAAALTGGAAVLILTLAGYR